MVNHRTGNAVLGSNLKNDTMFSVHFLSKSFTIRVIQIYAPITDSQEAEVYCFYEDLPSRTKTNKQKKKDVLFITGDWKCKSTKSRDNWSICYTGVTGKFGLGVQNEAEQRLTEFCQEKMLIIANTFSQKTKRWIYSWT